MAVLVDFKVFLAQAETGSLLPLVTRTSMTTALLSDRMVGGGPQGWVSGSGPKSGSGATTERCNQAGRVVQGRSV